MLGIVQRVIASWLADQAGVPRDTAQCGVVTLIQRFGSALDLNVHVHMPWLEGEYEKTTGPPQRKPRLRRVRAPTSAQLTQLADTIPHRVCRHLVRRGWLEGEYGSVFLSDSSAGDDGMDGHPSKSADACPRTAQELPLHCSARFVLALLGVLCCGWGVLCCG